MSLPVAEGWKLKVVKVSSDPNHSGILQNFSPMFTVMHFVVIFGKLFSLMDHFILEATLDLKQSGFFVNLNGHAVLNSCFSYWPFLTDQSSHYHYLLAG